jgi:hypothetical protein
MNYVLKIQSESRGESFFVPVSVYFRLHIIIENRPQMSHDLY